MVTRDHVVDSARPESPGKVPKFSSRAWTGPGASKLERPYRQGMDESALTYLSPEEIDAMAARGIFDYQRIKRMHKRAQARAAAGHASKPSKQRVKMKGFVYDELQQQFAKKGVHKVKGSVDSQDPHTQPGAPLALPGPNGEGAEDSNSEMEDASPGTSHALAVLEQHPPPSAKSLVPRSVSRAALGAAPSHPQGQSSSRAQAQGSHTGRDGGAHARRDARTAPASSDLGMGTQSQPHPKPKSGASDPKESSISKSAKSRLGPKDAEEAGGWEEESEAAKTRRKQAPASAPSKEVHGPNLREMEAGMGWDITPGHLARLQWERYIFWKNQPEGKKPWSPARVAPPKAAVNMHQAEAYATGHILSLDLTNTGSLHGEKLRDPFMAKPLRHQGNIPERATETPQSELYLHMVRDWKKAAPEDAPQPWAPTNPPASRTKVLMHSHEAVGNARVIGLDLENFGAFPGKRHRAPRARAEPDRPLRPAGSLLHWKKKRDEEREVIERAQRRENYRRRMEELALMDDQGVALTGGERLDALLSHGPIPTIEEAKPVKKNRQRRNSLIASRKARASQNASTMADIPKPWDHLQSQAGGNGTTRAAAGAAPPAFSGASVSAPTSQPRQELASRPVASAPVAPSIPKHYFHGPPEELLEEEARRVMSEVPPSELDQEVYYRQFSPRGQCLSKYKLHPPKDKPEPWRPSSLPSKSDVARARTAHAVAQGRAVSLDLLVEEVPPAGLGLEKLAEEEQGLGGEPRGGHAEMQLREAMKFKMQGLPGKVPWIPSSASKDTTDLLMQGSEALSCGQYISPDLRSTGERPKTSLCHETGIFVNPDTNHPGVEPGQTAAKQIKSYQNWKKKGPENKKAWKPSSQPTKVNDAKIVGSSAVASGQYISMDLRSSGYVPGMRLKEHGHALHVHPHQQRLLDSTRTKKERQAKMEGYAQHDQGYKKVDDSVRNFVRMVPPGIEKNKIGLIHGMVVS
mmetsp:Transcript_18794/g.35802  ORF Transcript_18794/g.35802 Transcript_18794/m.35802 type:complete len:975 (+) Transcript_18794:244-3168(+)|eukprot:CAMPEP_0114233956 /NCGR_PEP_ID=MMETSP0058-20121206/5457_1 /TAXON_ID=36894 /ORGANISM="Pyramimonas parkeae, CCMP726" /LENGTH=974 /DNA_ID=CAMNT_0001345613 /DNA_START=160 /DNA_END=3084 /DNA_ORIENTATION=-